MQGWPNAARRAECGSQRVLYVLQLCVAYIAVAHYKIRLIKKDKFTQFETVTSSCVTSLTDLPVASARRATLVIQKHSEPALLKLHQIKHTINRQSERSSVAMTSVRAMASRTGSGTAGMFTHGGA